MVSGHPVLPMPLIALVSDLLRRCFNVPLDGIVNEAKPVNRATSDTGPTSDELDATAFSRVAVVQRAS